MSQPIEIHSCTAYQERLRDRVGGFSYESSLIRLLNYKKKKSASVDTMIGWVGCIKEAAK
jgi:hypothetical protein